jgi:hypothetical protein
MASARITLSVDRDHYRAARAAAARMETTVSHLTDLFFESLAADPVGVQGSVANRLRGSFRGSITDDKAALVAALRRKHLG